MTSGPLTSDLGEVWNKWCVDDADWESNVSAEDGSMSEVALLWMMMHVLDWLL